MENHTNCKCSVCSDVSSGLSKEEAIKIRLAWEREAFEKYGFFVHFVEQDDSSPTNFNVHTHGMEAYDHLDFQIVIPLHAETAHTIISDIANRVKNGERFFAGQNVSKLIRGFDVKLIEAHECQRKVLRIVLPDKFGKLEENEISGNFALQYKDENFTFQQKDEDVVKPSWTPYKPKKC